MTNAYDDDPFTGQLDRGDFAVETPIFDDMDMGQIESDAPCSVWGLLGGFDSAWN
jgi:hypothetical protein